MTAFPEMPPIFELSSLGRDGGFNAAARCQDTPVFDFGQRSDGGGICRDVGVDCGRVPGFDSNDWHECQNDVHDGCQFIGKRQLVNDVAVLPRKDAWQLTVAGTRIYFRTIGELPVRRRGFFGLCFHRDTRSLQTSSLEKV
jgi:hypothetical protein